MSNRHFDRGDDRGGRPEPGHYTVRMVRGGPWLPARILYEDDTGFWRVEINGTEVGQPDLDPDAHPLLMRVWHHGRRSDELEHELMTATKAWAAKHQPEHPLLHPTTPIDLGALPPVLP